MVYLNNVPQAADSPATQSQADLLENFAQLETQFSGDHVSLMALANNGMHTQIRFEDVAAAPGLADPMGSIYMALVGADSELFFENFNNGTGLNAQIQLTNLAIANVGNAGTAAGTQYQIDFPIGVTVYCGTTIAFTGNATVVFPVALTGIYSTTVTANDVNVQRTSVAQGVAGLTIYTENNVTVNWMAIGTL